MYVFIFITRRSWVRSVACDPVASVAVAGGASEALSGNVYRVFSVGLDAQLCVWELSIDEELESHAQRRGRPGEIAPTTPREDMVTMVPVATHAFDAGDAPRIWAAGWGGLFRSMGSLSVWGICAALGDGSVCVA